MFMIRRSLAIGSILAMMVFAAGAAEAAPGYATANVNLRAGPGTQYPIVAVLHAGDPVEINGCISSWTWCDVEWRGYRGWAAGSSLQVLYQQRRGPITLYGRYLGIPFLGFSIESYWNNHYRSRPFYNKLPNFEKKWPPNFEKKRPLNFEKPLLKLEKRPPPRFEKKLPGPDGRKPYGCPNRQHLVNGVCQ